MNADAMNKYVMPNYYNLGAVAPFSTINGPLSSLMPSHYIQPCLMLRL